LKKILLTGANGFIGRNIQEILGNDYELINLVKESKYDINSLESLCEIDKVEIVIHTAAKTFVPDSFENPYSFYKFNIESTLNIAEFCRIKKVKKIIYLNSYTYGNPQYLPIDEKHPLSFHSPYNKSKYIAEELLFNYLDGVADVISLRLFNVYGRYQNDSFLIPTILKQANENKTIKVKDLKPKRDFVYIKDVITLIENSIKSEHISGIYNVGNGNSYSVEEIIAIITDTFDFDIKVLSENIRRENEVMDCIADTTKALQDLNWSPTFNMRTGLKDYIGEMDNDKL